MQRGVVVEPGGPGRGGDDDGGSGDEGPASHFLRNFEIVIAVLLGLAAVATAFAAYQTELRDGDALKFFQEGNRVADAASQQRNEASAKRNEDQIVMTFAIQAVINSPAEGEAADRLGNQLIDTLGSEELQTANRECQADPECENTPPIDSKYYVSPAAEEAERLEERADGLFARANAKDEQGDEFTLVTVFLATALFLYGVAAVAKARRVKLGTAGFGFAIFLVSLVLFASA